MVETQGTKSSIEMFDLESGIGQEGLSDQVIVINDVQIESEQDLTLQNAHFGSTDTRTLQSDEAGTSGNLTEEDNIDALQRLKVSVNEDALASAAEAEKFAAIPINLSSFASQGNERRAGPLTGTADGASIATQVGI